MRIQMIMIAGGAALASAAFAGTFTPIGETGGSYAFEGCARPAEPDLAVDPTLKGRERIAAQNAAVKRYNDHVSAVNLYLECISGEAERDLQTYYSAVSASLDAEQNAVLTRIEEMRASLKTRG